MNAAEVLSENQELQFRAIEALKKKLSSMDLFISEIGKVEVINPVFENARLVEVTVKIGVLLNKAELCQDGTACNVLVTMKTQESTPENSQASELSTEG